MAEKGRGATEWLSRWGFASLVAIGALAAAWVAATVPIPADVPSFALQATAVYRLEVGGAVFAGAYLVSLALVLALNNRGFSEIGASGVKAADLTGEMRGDNSRDQAESLAGIRQRLEVMEALARRRDPR